MAYVPISPLSDGLGLDGPPNEYWNMWFEYIYFSLYFSLIGLHIARAVLYMWRLVNDKIAFGLDSNLIRDS